MIANFAAFTLNLHHLGADRPATGGAVGSEQCFIVLFTVWLIFHDRNLFTFQRLLAVFADEALRVPFPIERGEDTLLR